MADSVRFKNTSATVTFDAVKDILVVRFRGSFEERPIKVTVNQARLDIYISLEYGKRIIESLIEVCGKSVMEKKDLPWAPDPRDYREGYTSIPLKGVPSTQCSVRNISIDIPRWTMAQAKSRIFLDIEEDKKYGRIQLHLGTGFGFGNCKFTGGNAQLSSINTCSGKIELETRSALILKSYLHHFGA